MLNKYMRRFLIFVFIGFAASVQAQWSQLGGPPGGNMVDLERLASGKLFSISNQTLFESTNNGVTWTKTTIVSPTTNFFIDDIAVDAASGKLYAINYAVLYTSTDGGANWIKVSSDGQFYGMYRIRPFGPDGFIALSGWNGVYVSKDGGVNFTKILDDNIYDQNRLRTNSAGDLFAPTRFGIKRYLYPGAGGTFSSANWELVFTTGGDTYEVNLGIDGSNGLFAQLNYRDGSNNYFSELRGSSSANNGNVGTWNLLPRSGLPNNEFSGSWGANGSRIYFLNNNNGKIYSNNSFATTTFNLAGGNYTSGDNYFTVTSSYGALKLGDQISAAGIPAGSYVTDLYPPNAFRISKNPTSSGSGVALTVTTLSTSWTIVDSPTKPFGSNMSNIVFASATNFIIGSDADGIFYTTNTGTSFTQGTGLKSGNGTQVAVANTTGRMLYLGNYSSQGYWTSTDNGAAWTFKPLSSYVRRILKLNSGNLLLYGDRTYRSTDNGANFTEVSPNYRNLIREHPTTAGRLYAMDCCNLFLSTDGGANWGTAITLTGLPASYNFEWMTVSDADIIYMVLYDYGDNKRHIYKIDAGTATELPNAPWAELENYYLNNIFIYGGALYVSSGAAIYKTSNEGSSWATSNFSGSYVFPITQGAYSGIVISRYGTMYITQDDGKTFNSAPLPTSNSFVTSLAQDLSGNLIASASNSPALKYTGSLTVDPATLPPFIDFNWQPTNGPFGGHTQRVLKDNANNSYAITSGRLYKTTTFVSWQKVPILDQNGNNIDVQDMAYDAIANKLYVAGYSDMYTSIDAGANWVKINTEPLKGLRLFRRMPNGNIVYFTYDNGSEIYVSVDGGATYGLPKYELDNENFDKLAVTSSAIFLNLFDYDINKRKLLRSLDNGVTWTEPTIPLSFLDNISADANNIYIWSGSQLYKSTDNANSWTNISGDLNQGLTFESNVYTAPNNDLVVIGHPYGIIRSANGGANWTKTASLSNDNPILDLIWVGTRLVFGTGYGVYTSDDEALTYTKRSNGIEGYYFNDLKLIGNQRLLAGGNSKPFVSNDFQNWSDIGGGAGNYFNGLTELPSGELIAWQCGSIYRSSDGGQNWTRYDANTCIDQLFSADGVNFYNRQYDKIQYTTDFTTWTDLTISGLPTTGYNELVVDDNNIVYIKLWNQTAQVTEVYQILFGSALKLNFTNDPRSISYNNGKILIYDGQGTIHETSDGSTWTTKGAASGDKLIITSNNYFFIPSYGGVLWLSRDEGLSWQQVGISNMNNETFTDVVVNEFDGYAYASISRSVVWKSANIVIPPDATPPVIAPPFSPANNATAVLETTNLTITFDEPVVPQSGKTLRILDLANPIVALETIDVTAGVQNGKSFTYNPTIALGYNKTYFVVIDNGSFEDIFGNAFAGIINNSTWRFTTREEPDTQAPTIVMVTTSLNLEKGVAKTLEVKVTDNKIVPTDKTKIWYRGITKLETVAFTSANMTAGTGNGTVETNFTVTAAESWYDEMGIEFYIESEDNAGNKTTFPAGSYNYSYINYPAAARPVFPAGRISFGGQESNYRMISVPFTLADKQTTTILNELGAVDKTKWRMFTYETSGKKFTENPTSFERGKGYWINVRNSPGDIFIEGATTPANNKTNFYTMRFYDEWNQIGNPYPVAINWSQVKANNPELTELKVYNGSTYTNATELSPFEGGFVFVNLPVNVAFLDVKVRFKDILSGGRVREELGSDLSKSNWVVPILATNHEITNKFGGVGMHEQATLDWDQFDDINPPRFLNGAELAFSRENLTKLPLSKDIVPTSEEFEWDFSTISSEGTTVLSWENSLIQGDKDLMLFDVGNQILIDMKQQGSYSFASAENKEFKIYFGVDLDKKIKPTSVSLGKPFPNPASNVSTIKYTLPENQATYRTLLEVYNSVGKRVTTLNNGEQAPGFYTAEWDTANNQNGLYFYRLTVVENGNARSLTEKVIINK